MLPPPFSQASKFGEEREVFWKEVEMEGAAKTEAVRRNGSTARLRHLPPRTDGAGEIELKNACIRRIEMQQLMVNSAQLIDDTRTAWIDIDSFITAHRTVKREEAGFMHSPRQRQPIDDFMTMCSQRSEYYRKFFLDNSEPSIVNLQFREFARALHIHFESCILKIGSLEPEKGLNSGPFYSAVEYAHELRAGVGEMLVKMEAFLLNANQEER